MIRFMAQVNAHERDQAEHAKAQVADRAVSNQLLDVLLHPGDQRTIDDADDAQHSHEWNDGIAHNRHQPVGVHSAQPDGAQQPHGDREL